jgi:hypothetical protein
VSRHWLVIVPLFLVVILAILMSTTTPLQVGPAGILLAFLLLYAILLSISFLIIYIGSKLFVSLKLRKGHQLIRPRRAYYIASIVACLPLFLIAIQTIGQLRWVDVLLVVVFLALAAFYVLRRT